MSTTKKTFVHSFFPPGQNPAKSSEVELSVQSIEDAGVREVLQTPGVALGSWEFLDALIAKSSDFSFLQPLGQAREVKVALSGLFGRFVARAYLEEWIGLRFFAHLGRSTLTLGGKFDVRVERRKGARGDLPDWVACQGDLSRLTVAEAKGSHDPSGPGRALSNAIQQAGRVDVWGHGGKLKVKRVSIATRWGMLHDGPPYTHIAVHDPLEEGAEDDAAFLGIARHHLANLLDPLGHSTLAEILRAGADPTPVLDRDVPMDQAGDLIEQGSRDGLRIREGEAGEAIGEAVLGGVVTRAGVVRDVAIALDDIERLANLDLRPMWVGVRREVVNAAIAGDVAFFRETEPPNLASEQTVMSRRDDSAIGIVVRLQ